MATDFAQRFADTEVFLNRRSAVAPPWFDPAANQDGDLTDLLATSPVLCVGAGGLGCEILKDLALTGFKNIHVIDMDTIDVTNLNRQFLFRMEDVGKTKAEVAAKRVMERVDGCEVTAHVGRIEERDPAFYDQFLVIVLGLDSLEARRYMNKLVCDALEFNPDGSVKEHTMKPLVDGGTEGFKGHARVILPGKTPCFDCTLWLFPRQIKFPLCTLAETPRSAAHCIEYAHLLLWPKHWGSTAFDSDNEEHMRWVFERAMERASEFSIGGVTLQLTQGVVKNIIPAIPSTNAIVAAACVFETFKIMSSCFHPMSNYMMFSGTEGVYTHTTKYSRLPECSCCGAGTAVDITPEMTLSQLLASLQALGAVQAPTISVEGKVLYMTGPAEPMYHPNLERPLSALLLSMPDEESSVMGVVTDPKLKEPSRVRLVLSDAAMASSE